MNSIPFHEPAFEESAFNCPHCFAYANMSWVRAFAQSGIAIRDTNAAGCSRCQKWSLWVGEIMVYPDATTVSPPNDDLPDEVKADYLEAASIFGKSPRGAAALLRLAIQKLCDDLVDGSENLNSKIGELVKRGLNKKIQQALDVVRVIGNEGVHPGQIDLNDDPETAKQLFRLVNMIGQQMITEPGEVDAMFEALPDGKKQQVEERDNRGSSL